MTEQPGELHLTLSVTEVNQILTSLGREPYESVFLLIAKLQQQAEAQLATADAEESPS